MKNKEEEMVESQHVCAAQCIIQSNPFLSGTFHPPSLLLAGRSKLDAGVIKSSTPVLRRGIR
jgi:hypothetical protein